MKRFALGVLLFSGGCDAITDVLPETSPAAPEAPTVVVPASPFAGDVAVLRGTRPANTALLLDDVEVIPRAREGAYVLPLPLAVGANAVELVAVDAVGRRSPPTPVTIVRDGTAPGPIVFVGELPARTTRSQLSERTLQKPADCLVRKDGRTLEIDLTATAATIDVELVPGPQTIRFACADTAGNESALTTIEIERRDVAEDLFVLDPIEASVTTSTLTLSATCDDDIEARIGAQPPQPCTDGTWQSTVALVLGPQRITVTAAFAGEFDVQPLVLTRDITRVAEGEGEGEQP
jgi:hypothetical protein